MGNYFWSISGIERDELQGRPGELVDIWNINVGASAVIERGMLLGASSPTGEFSLVDSTVGAADKVFVVARDNFTAEGASAAVTQAYSRGFFNRERIKLGGGSAFSIAPLEGELRKQNILLTSIQDKF